MKPFEFKPLLSQSIIQKIIKKYPKENFSIELNNIFATVESPDKLATQMLDGILEKFKLKVNKKVILLFEGIYKRYLEYVLIQDIYDKELTNLQLLKSYFGLSDVQVDEIFNDVATRVYKHKVNNILSDGRVDEKEKKYLGNLQKQLKLPQEIADNIYKTQAKSYVEEYTKKTLEDERLSPEEEKELQEIAKSFDINLVMDEESKATLDKFRLLWLVENGDLKEIPVSINLKKSEKCYLKIDGVDLFEYRKVPSRVNYHGPTARIKIMKGIYYRAGSLKFNIPSDDTLVKIDSGNMYFTNTRIIFNGLIKNQSLNYSKILDFNIYSNGLEIQKDAGRNPFFLFNEQVDVAAVLLKRLMNESS